MLMTRDLPCAASRARMSGDLGRSKGGRSGLRSDIVGGFFFEVSFG